MIGRTISHYRIVEKLGEGGMGLVYVAEDTHLRRRVAFKTLTARGGDNQHFRARFLREARAVSALSHPNIAAIYDYGQTEQGDPYIVMELIKGETLGDLMHKEKLTIPRSIEIIKQVAEALGEAHAQGIIHRDIKPSNVALNERGNVKVLDFGLAKQIQQEPANPSDPEQRTLMNTQTREGVIVGTPLYLSPEQALSVEVDARSDLFTVGSLLYECITGKPAFDGNKPAEIIANILREDPLAPSKINPDVPEELDDIVEKALAKKPEARYQSAAELIVDLENARSSILNLDHTVTRMNVPANGTHPTGALATLSDIFRRPRLSIGYVSAAAAVVLVIALVAYFATRGRPHKPTAEAQKWFDIGTNYLREGSYFRAIKPLEQALSLDEQFALAHARLAEAWTELDYSERAQLQLLRVDGLVPDRSILDKVDRLYLDATRAAITRDFGAAIAANQQIVALKPKDATAYLDLGRAFEKNDEIDKAIDSFEHAVQLDPQYAAAFLRLGILRGRKEDLPNSTAAFAKADELFQTLGDSEGRTEVLYQRGAVLSKIGKLDEAEDQLQKALDLSRNLNNQFQQIKAMLALSSVLQTRGKTSEAKQQAVDAVNLAQSAGIENLATQGLIDLGDTYLVRREYAEAEQVLKQALDFARRNKGRRNEALSLLRLAKLLIQQETRTDEAIGYLEPALQYFQQGGYNKEVSLAILLRGRARLLKGDYQGALQDFQQQLEFAKQTNNQSQLASTYLLIGNLYKDLELYPDALKNFEQSYSIYKTLDVPITMGYLLADQSEMLAQLGHADEARTILSQLPGVTDRLDSNYRQVLLARMAIVQSQLALNEERFSDAKTFADQALKLAGTSVNHAAVEAKYQLGLSETRSGTAKAGLTSILQAAEMCKEVHDEHLTSIILLGQAEALLASGAAKRALEAALAAQQRFAAAEQYESEWQAWLVAGQASAKLNDNASPMQLRKADEVLSELAAKWGDAVIRVYLSRPDLKTKHDNLNVLLRLHPS